MRLFINQLNDPNAEEHAANCSNAYWQHPKEDGHTDQQPREMTRRTERVICRLMTQGIYFANAWSSAVKANIEGNSKNDKEIKGLIRCTIVDIYQDILREDTCEGHWGTYYAWYVVEQISGGLTANGGENDCTRGKYKTIQLNTWPMRNKMKTWLKQNKQMKEKLAQEEISGGCTGRQVKTRKQLQEEGVIKENEAEKKEDEKLKSQMKTHFRKILDTLQIQMKEEEGKLRASRAQARPDPSVVDDEEKEGDDIEEHIKNAVANAREKLGQVIVIPASATPATGTTQQTPGAGAAAAAQPVATPPATTKPVVERTDDTTSATHPAHASETPENKSTARGTQTGQELLSTKDPQTAGGAGSSVGRKEDDEPPAGPPPPPPRPPPPPSGKSGDDAAGTTREQGDPGVAGPPGPTEKSGEDKCKQSLGKTANSSGPIVISTGCTSDADLGGGQTLTDAIANGNEFREYTYKEHLEYN
ncbi:hypothetical protein AK88_05525 [Plasmodium fragile]|uniref:Schizont-infected cell agglutination extracellular alpha domain-containing protein n=1 Tax=Plasmodium fragile TaxID=5857 RepID=A0A0D9QGJ6_PLAFR|nr:uncharacterized protein AK88_05525 [Plasmodium fragile]KJP84846.1 hypothetical protein AK88_05525 [Plasmodium fragile]